MNNIDLFFDFFAYITRFFGGKGRKKIFYVQNFSKKNA